MDIYGYLRAQANELGSRILESYPPLQSTTDEIPDDLSTLLRTALPAQAIAIGGLAKHLRSARAARIVAECGAGKTHLAVALAETAIQSGNGAYFMTAHDLVTDLGRAYREGRLDRRMRVYLAPKVLIINEMGYLPLDDLGATIFFQLVSARYERGSIILTSNKSYGEWGSIFGDPIIATAILDRLLHHSTTINIRGESYRLKERRKAGLIPLPDQQHDEPAALAHRSRSKHNQLP